MLPLDRDPLVGSQGRPELLQIIKTADFGPEQMDNNIARIDKDPIALRNAFDPQVAKSRRFQLFYQLVGYGGDVAVRAAGGDDHLIGDGAFAVKVDRSYVLGFCIIETTEYRGQKLGKFFALERRFVRRGSFAQAATSGYGFQGCFPLSNAQKGSGPLRGEVSSPVELQKVSARTPARFPWRRI
jgi:hypothetical protein